MKYSTQAKMRAAMSSHYGSLPTANDTIKVIDMRLAMAMKHLNDEKRMQRVLSSQEAKRKEEHQLRRGALRGCRMF